MMIAILQHKYVQFAFANLSVASVSMHVYLLFHIILYLFLKFNN